MRTSRAFPGEVVAGSPVRERDSADSAFPGEVVAGSPVRERDRKKGAVERFVERRNSSFARIAVIRSVACAVLIGCTGTAPAWAQPAMAMEGPPVPPADIPAAGATAGMEAQGAPQPGSAAPSVEVLAAAPQTAAPLPADPNLASTAADAAFAMANMFGAANSVSGEELLEALEAAAEAGQPLAMWRLGVMYENGEGVEKDQVRAFGYFSRIANEHANTPPRSLEADVVAQSFVKIGDYYRQGLPGAGIQADSDRSEALMLHAATYFGDADAQYRVGQLYLDENGLGVNALQSARWLSLAARKGHIAAQARLGQLLFEGNGIEQQPVEGLMWLTIAHNHSRGTSEQGWVAEELNKAMSIATPDQRTAALDAANQLGQQLFGY